MKENSENSQPEICNANIGDAQLQYLLYDGEGDTIVFLYATGFLPWLWHPIARQLTPRFRVIVPYFSDHRYVEPEEGGLNWQILAEDFISFLDTCNINSPYLAGHSMGASVATLSEALKGPRAKKMVLIEPIYLPEQIYSIELTIEQHPLASKSIKRRNGWKDRDEVRSYLLSKKLFQSWDKEVLELYIKHGMVPGRDHGLELACSPRREASLFMGSRFKNPWPLLETVKCPVLVVEGEESDNRVFIDLKKAVSLFHDGHYTSVPGASHLVPMEKPLAVTEIIKSFFQEDK